MKAALIAVCSLVVALLVYERWPENSPSTGGTLNVSELLGEADATGFDRAIGSRTFDFPRDHGPHPGYRTEWWYFTGNLEAADGRAFGYQLTFFRSALAPEPAADAGRASRWGTRQVFMAHFALTDVAGNRFFATERFSRAALGLAGAQATPFRVWLEGWNATATGDDFLPLRLHAETEEVALTLTLGTAKPVVLQGDGGLSQKGAAPGNASWYYAFTRMPSQGELQLGNEVVPVRGESWMDREWSTSALAPGLVGWDWFALHLANGYDLMLYQLRTQTGQADPFSAGTLVAPDGAAVHLAASEFGLEPLSFWTSPRSGTRYPIRWRVTIPGHAVALTVEAAIPDQELDVSVRYWEGSVRVEGTFSSAAVAGRGYLELTGYPEPVTGPAR
ncbi:MAG: carotenoid 1,2-hydratase [Myxococcota bacterium]|nr:carotenoid 1,2-hydratase [Myxococcota bacterium]